LIGLIHGPQGGSAKIIDQYYDLYEQYEEEIPEQNRIKRRFAAVLEAIKRLFPKIDEGRWGNRADFYSIFVALGTLFLHQTLPLSKEKKLAAKLLRFAEDVDERLEDPTAKTSEASASYARAIEKGSNDKARRADRQEALIEVITPFLTKPKNKTKSK